MPDGTIKDMPTPPQPRQLHLQTVADLCAMAADHFDKDVAKNNRMIITYGLNNAGGDGYVQLHFDHSKCTEYAIATIGLSEEFRIIQGWFQPQLLQVQSLRTMLRYDMRHAAPSGLEEQVSQLTVTTQGTNAAKAGRQGESLSSAVNRTIQEDQAASMPDMVQDFDVRMFKHAEFPERFNLKVLIDPDTETGDPKWIVRYDDDSMAAFQESVLKLMAYKITEGLGDANVPVYRGSVDAPIFAVRQ